MTTLADQVDAAVSWTLAARANPTTNGQRAVLARGTHPQHYADAYGVLAAAGHLTSVPPKVRRGAVAACALAAAHPRTPNSRGQLGAAFRSIDSPSIGRILSTATGASQPVATRLLASLVGRVTTVNFYDLARTLAFWDTGSLTARREHRTRIIFDFHAATKEPTR